tara:strand:+ start:400 stop:669 length:270 start_codon:yes stop_codon:yes gene_type:complete
MNQLQRTKIIMPWAGFVKPIYIMIKLEYYTDENVIDASVNYIKKEMKKGDVFTTRKLQRLLNIGYNKTLRIFNHLFEKGLVDRKTFAII